MNQKEWNEGLNNLDPALVASYTEQKDKLRKKKKQQRFWLRFGAAAACLALIVGAFAVVPGWIGADPEPEDPNVFRESDLLTLPLIQSGRRMTGLWEASYGDPVSLTGGDVYVLSPHFFIRTVIEARVIEVLPDSYFLPGSSYSYHVARLEVVDSVRGEGLPEEIWFRFAYYSADVLEGYDTFLLSLAQVGIENYMMINENTREACYFSDMFDVCRVNDLGYGSVIAFRDGKVDVSFWNRVTHKVKPGRIERGLLEDFTVDPDYPIRYISYPVGHDSTIEEAKANVLKMLGYGEEFVWIEPYSADYTSVEDVFLSEESRQIKEDLLDSLESNVFAQKLVYGVEDELVSVEYTRVINGFITKEYIVVDSRNRVTGEVGVVSRSKTVYTPEELARIPDLSAALQIIKLAELPPPHIKVTEEMTLKHAIAKGVYRKVDGKIYGIISIVWTYRLAGDDYRYMKDDCYYLYDENGKGTKVGRNELIELIGFDGSVISNFKYNEIICVDY